MSQSGYIIPLIKSRTKNKFDSSSMKVGWFFQFKNYLEKLALSDFVLNKLRKVVFSCGTIWLWTIVVFFVKFHHSSVHSYLCLLLNISFLSDSRRPCFHISLMLFTSATFIIIIIIINLIAENGRQENAHCKRVLFYQICACEHYHTQTNITNFRSILVSVSSVCIYNLNVVAIGLNKFHYVKMKWNVECSLFAKFPCQKPVHDHLMEKNVFHPQRQQSQYSIIFFMPLDPFCIVLVLYFYKSVLASRAHTECVNGIVRKRQD